MNGDERVIFRIEKNPYVNGTSYLAAFPDEEAARDTSPPLRSTSSMD